MSAVHVGILSRSGEWQENVISLRSETALVYVVASLTDSGRLVQLVF